MSTKRERTRCPGIALVARRAVTEQARVGLTLRNRLHVGAWLERVERRADGFVGRRYLDHLSTTTEANHHLVVVVDRARGLAARSARAACSFSRRRAPATTRALRARGAETVGSRARARIELRCPRVDAFLKPRDCIPSLGCAIIDRVALDVLRREPRPPRTSPGEPDDRKPSSPSEYCLAVN